tara:strand:+ start:68 stop:1456 length:1389 start_codon:yes stop_codon:yes gene_type:complete
MKANKSLKSFCLLSIILFYSGCSNDNVTEDSPIYENPLAIMTISKSTLDFGYFEQSLSLFLSNEGETTFSWNWDNNSNSFLELNPSSGNLNVGESIEVHMTLNRTDLVTQNYNLETFVTNNFDQSETLNIQIDHFLEDKWLIDGDIIDVEYDRNNNVIVVVSENPNELRVFDPSENSISAVPLNLPPSCISVGLDGNHAVVGHNGWFSYVNLSTMQLEDTYAITANIYDIVLAPNNWVYVFPEEDQWERIRCIDLSNGVETQHSGSSIYEQTKAKLHPSGNFIYGADTQIAPSDFEKYEISNGTAQYLYDSPYHGDFPFDGDIWISEDGSRLFAKSRRVFNGSSIQANDMTYNGELVGDGYVVTLDYSSAAGKVYAIFSPSDFEEQHTNEIRTYETDFLAFEGTIELSSFLVPGGNNESVFYESRGYFGFFNSDGTKYYVIVKAEEGSGAENEWAIATIDVE